MAGAEIVGERYELLRRLDGGGMGEVWTASDTRLGGKVVAVKRLPARADGAGAIDVELFRREAYTVSRLRHPNVVGVTDFFVESGSPFIVMEYVEGTTLTAWAQAAHRPHAAMLAMARQMVSALGAVHAAGLVHRDVKPDNVVVRPDGSAVLVDFGIARGDDDPALTSTGYFRGTLSYTAPEILEGGTASPASDMWSLGATLFEMVEGRRAFSGASQTAIMAAILLHPLPRPSMSGPLADVVIALLDRTPAGRPSAHDLGATLGRAGRGAPVPPVPVAPRAEPTAPSRVPPPPLAPPFSPPPAPAPFGPGPNQPSPRGWAPTETVPAHAERGSNPAPFAPTITAGVARAASPRPALNRATWVLWGGVVVAVVGFVVAAFLQWVRASTSIYLSAIKQSSSSVAYRSGLSRENTLAFAIALVLTAAVVVMAAVAGRVLLTRRRVAPAVSIALAVVLAAGTVLTIVLQRRSAIHDEGNEIFNHDLHVTLEPGTWVAAVSALIAVACLVALGVQQVRQRRRARVTAA